MQLSWPLSIRSYPGSCRRRPLSPGSTRVQVEGVGNSSAGKSEERVAHQRTESTVFKRSEQACLLEASSLPKDLVRHSFGCVGLHGWGDVGVDLAGDVCG
jgi:hypothetical protein